MPDAARTTMSQPSVLILCGTYLPGFKAGGPVQSVANLVSALEHEFRFGIIAADRDIGDAQPYPGIQSGRWLKRDGSQVFYVPRGRLSVSRFLSAAREFAPDLVYLNSFFSPAFSLVPKVCRRCGLGGDRALVLAPRGEFSPGAFAIKSWKKRPYLALDKALGLSAGVTFHATSDDERGHITRAMGPHARVVVARNISAAPVPGAIAPRRKHSPARLVFLSRIAPKKNLDGALRYLARVRSALHFTIAGPPEDDAYWRACEARVNALPANIGTTIEGPVAPAFVPALFARHDFLFLPTKGENFGHVIAEALSAGVPVITSDQTPWSDLEAAGAGWTLPLDDERAWMDVLDACAVMEPERYAEMSARAGAYATKMLSVATAVDEHRALFHAAVGRWPSTGTHLG